MGIKIGSPFAVSAAELNRRFGEVRRRVAEAPVAITYHGRTIIYMVGAEQFEALQSLRSDAQVGSAWKRKFQLILDHIREGYFSFGEDSTIRTVNRVAELFVGRTRDEMVGLPLEEAFPGTGHIFDQIQTVAETGEIHRVERASTLHPDRRVAITMIPLPLPEGGVGVLFDNITEQSRMHQGMAEQEQLIGHLLDAVDDRIIFTVSAKSRIEWWGQGARLLLGWDAAEVQHAPLQSILVSSTPPPSPAEGKEIVELRHKDGSVIAAAGLVEKASKDGAGALYILTVIRS